MTFMLRDRPDGQVEIIINRPVLVGIFPEREVAARVCAFLQEDAVELPDTDPANFARAAQDVAEVEADDLNGLEGEDGPFQRLLDAGDLVEAPPPAKRQPRVQLPAVVPERPRQAVQIAVKIPVVLTEAQVDGAYAGIAGGEKIADVARTIGIPFTRLRGMWAAHCRQLQKHMAEGGPQPCALCAAPFTPSLSHPETCARCSRE